MKKISKHSKEVIDAAISSAIDCSIQVFSEEEMEENSRQAKVKKDALIHRVRWLEDKIHRLRKSK